MKFYIYELWDLIKNEPFYVGKGMRHFYDTDSNNRYMYHIKKALGVKNQKDNNRHKLNRIKKIISQGSRPEPRIVFETDDETEAFNKEKQLIKFYGRRDLGTGCLTNMTEGGDGVSGRIFSQAERLLISKRVTGPGNPMFGKTHTPEAKKRISDLKKTRPIYHHAEEWKTYLRSNKSYLKKYTLARSKPVYQIDFNGTVIKIWPSGFEAARVLNFSRENICSCALFKYRSYKGFYWLYEKDADIKNNRLENIDALNSRRLMPHMKKAIIQCDLNGSRIKIWESALQIKRELGIDNSIISNIIRCKRQSNVYKGFIWQSNCM